MKRILLVGCPGSGKSTVAKTLGSLLNIPVIHLDTEFWQPGWTLPEGADWVDRVEALIEEDTWIMDGTYARTFGVRIARADTVLHFDFPRLLCLWRVLKRSLTAHGRTRSDMAPGCPERLNGRFLHYVWTFRERITPQIEAHLDLWADEKQIVALRSPAQVHAFLDELHGKVGQH